MSKIDFIKDPFPDNHDGFDYSPKSHQDIQREMSQEEKASQENKLMSMLASVFK